MKSLRCASFAFVAVLVLVNAAGGQLLEDAGRLQYVDDMGKVLGDFHYSNNLDFRRNVLVRAGNELMLLMVSRTTIATEGSARYFASTDCSGTGYFGGPEAAQWADSFVPAHSDACVSISAGGCEGKVYGVDPLGAPATIMAQSYELGGICQTILPQLETDAIPTRFLLDLEDEYTPPFHLETAESPAQTAANTIGDVEDLLATAPAQSTRSLEIVIDSLEKVVVALSMTPPDTKTASLNLDAATRGLEMAAQKGLPTATVIALMDDVVGVSRELATAAIAVATAGGGSSLKIGQAQSLLAQGDSLRSSALAGASRDFRPAGRKYGDSTARAESAI